jgi:diguanylate cyclase (GGDEF)-like protein
LIKITQNVKSPLNEEDGYLPRLKGIVYQQLGNDVQASYWLDQSLATATRDHDIRLLRMVHENYAEFHLANKRTKQAEKHALTSLTYANELQHHNSIATLHYILSNIHQLNGNNEKAFICLSLYTDFLTSDSNKNIISLLTMMSKRMDSTVQKNKIIALENKVITAELQAQKSYNEQYFTYISILIVTFAFIILTIVYFIRTRILSMKVALSMKDSLTGAFGRSYLQHYLPGAMARYLRVKDDEESFGVIAIDCDDFKLINEKHGHAGGDAALKAIVAALMIQIRTNDHLFRWGGDEFVLMCEQVTQAQLSEIAQRLTFAVNNIAIEYDHLIMSPTISVGYALHKKDVEFDLGCLLKQADKFLYQTKRTGKNSFIGG